MNYFLDSNVIVSHIFSWDSLNIIANDFISSENYFCSDNVIKEVENVFNEKCQEYDYFLLMLCRLFENFSDNNFIYFYDVYRFINRVNPKSKFDIEDMRQALRIIFLKAINILMEYLCIGDCINLLEFKQNN